MGKHKSDSSYFDSLASDNHLRFRRACQYGQSTAVEAFIFIYGDSIQIALESEDHYAFRWACYEGHLEVVKLLVNAYGANIPEGLMAKQHLTLRLACEAGHVEIVKTLLAVYDEYNNFLNLNVLLKKDFHGESIIDWACNNPASPTSLLIQNRYQCLVKEQEIAYQSNFMANTTLHLYVINNKADKITAFLNNQPDDYLVYYFNLKNHLGMTALHTAAVDGDPKVIYALLKACPEDIKSAVLSERNSDGLTALQIATIQGHDEAAAILTKANDEYAESPVKHLRRSYD